MTTPTPIDPGPLVMDGDSGDWVIALDLVDGATGIAQMDSFGLAPKDWPGYAAWLVRASNEYTVLVEALQPLADFADKHARMDPSWVITQGSSLAARQLTMGDCYRARALLDKLKASQE